MHAGPSEGQGDALTSRRFTAAVVGLGQVGMGYDYGSPDSRRVVTHARAFSTHPGFELVGGADVDQRQRERFEAQYRRPAYGDLGDLVTRHRPDVVAVSVPTPGHGAVVHAVLDSRPGAVVCEKPLAATVEEGRDIVERARREAVPLLVNYIRRFDPGTIDLRKRLGEGDIGEVYKAVAWYSKGILNNGSHFVDLLSHLFGPISDPVLLDAGREGSGGDPEPDVRITAGSVDVTLLSARSECFSMGEMLLVGTGGCVRYLDGGQTIEIQHVEPHPEYEGYRRLSPDARRLKTDLGRYQWNVVDALYGALTHQDPLASDGASALETLSAVHAIIRMRSAGRLHPQEAAHG